MEIGVEYPPYQYTPQICDETRNGCSFITSFLIMGGGGGRKLCKGHRNTIISEISVIHGKTFMLEKRVCT